MYSPDAIKRDFSNAASAYDNEAVLQHAYVKTLVGEIAPHLANDAHIFDAGCGTGSFHRYAQQAGKGWRIIGGDLAFSMCHAANAAHPVVNAAIEQLPFPDACFDAVVSSFTLQWVGSPERAIAECARVVKPDGVIALQSFGAATLQELTACFRKLDTLLHTNDFPDIVALQQIMQANHLTILQRNIATHITRYPALTTLTTHLKTIGATNKHDQRRRGLLTPRYWRRLEEIYAQDYATPEGLPATWEVVRLVGRR